MSITTIFNNLPEDKKRTALNELFEDNILTFIHFMERDIEVHDHNWMNFCFKCHIYCPGADVTLKLCSEHRNIENYREYMFCDDCTNTSVSISCEICEKSL